MEQPPPAYLPMPYDAQQHWASVQKLATAEFKNLGDLAARMSDYSEVQGWNGLAAALRPDAGEGATSSSSSTLTEPRFLQHVLPEIVRRALELPDKVKASGIGRLPILQQRFSRRVSLPRELGASLLANMFLCTFDRTYDAMQGRRLMPDPSFVRLIWCKENAPQEVAKLRMFLHFFDRIAGQRLRGDVIIERVAVRAPTHAEWRESSAPLLEMEMAQRFESFESQPTLAHADFANKYIGGGVLSGGCVQEEIRFAICPELCLSLLLCPVMLDTEAIQIVGAEQFSAYTGYAFKLKYAGPHDDTSKRDENGTLQTAVLAMDAVDFRRAHGNLFHAQMDPRCIVRELNKCRAAFHSGGIVSLEKWPAVATGNWGSGVFGGFAPLKALLQWAAASLCGRRITYFPYEQGFGEELKDVSKRAVHRKATVGQLLHAIDRLAQDLTTEQNGFLLSQFYDYLREETQKAQARGGASCFPRKEHRPTGGAPHAITRAPAVAPRAVEHAPPSCVVKPATHGEVAPMQEDNILPRRAAAAVGAQPPLKTMH